MGWSLAELLGQEETLARLAREFATGRMAHAYMLEGPRGTGKLAMARGMAALLLCEHPVSANGIASACGACRHCLLLAHGAHPDYLELPREPAELRIGRFVERTGGTEAIDHQPVLPFLRLKPVEGSWRVAVIPDAERMRQEAANAFLKTLEEPPGQTLLILTTSARDRLPATVSSRCRRVGVRPLSPEAIARELGTRGAAAEADAAGLAVAAEGSLGLALELASGGVLELWRWLETEAFANPGAVSAQALADAWSTAGAGADANAGKRRSALEALDLTALVLRRRLREGLDPDRAEKALAALWTAADQIVRNVKPDLVLLSCAFEVMAALR